MSEGCKIIYEGGSAEIVEKKSRFIALVFPVHEEEKAIGFIEKTKKKYWDARHHCFAYVIGDKNQVQRCSDDGEPSGTAGRPILEVILGEEVHDVLIIVVRYFGGTLLGTGGLVRAYSQAAKEGLAQSVTVLKYKGEKLEIHTDYNGVGKLQYIAAQMELQIMDSEYGESVTLFLLVPTVQIEAFTKKVTEVTCGKAKIESLEELEYVLLDGKAEVYTK